MLAHAVGEVVEFLGVHFLFDGGEHQGVLVLVQGRRELEAQRVGLRRGPGSPSVQPGNDVLETFDMASESNLRFLQTSQCLLELCLLVINELDAEPELALHFLIAVLFFSSRLPVVAPKGAL